MKKAKKKKFNTTKSKMIRRRESLRNQQKYDQAVDEDVKRNKHKAKPFVKAEAKAKIEDVQTRLEENLRVLKALEEEYEKDQTEKKVRNEELESQGHNTLQEKMDAINKQAVEDLRRLEQGRDTGDYGEFEDSLMKNWEMEKDAKEALSAANASEMLKDAQKSTANTISDLFGGSAACVAKDKAGKVLHTSGVDRKKPGRKNRKKS